MSLAEEKRVLRQEVKQWRSSIDDQFYKKVSARIGQTLLDLSVLDAASVVHCYVSMNERREVDTRPVLETLLDLGKQVVIPRMHSNGSLSHHQIEDLDSLSTNDWGVSEPDPNLHPEINPSKLDIVVVPLAAADVSCQRLGYGKGYYDRFLAPLEIPTVGLCYERWLLESVPAGEHDVPLQMIITEDRVQRCI